MPAKAGLRASVPLYVPFCRATRRALMGALDLLDVAKVVDTSWEINTAALARSIDPKFYDQPFWEKCNSDFCKPKVLFMM